MSDQLDRLEEWALSAEGPAYASPTIPDVTLKDLQFMVVDDDEGFRTMIRDWLGDQGIANIAEASDGADAVELAERVEPDVILMDVRMPRLSGIVAAELIKANRPDVHIIMLTGYGEEAFKRAGVAAGVYRYLSKDCPPELLWRAIEEAATSSVQAKS
jgi:CheY-like chemotaxis protein